MADKNGEILETYDLDGNLIKTEKRDAFYRNIRKEFKQKGMISRQVKSIRLLLLNSNGRVYIQRRSDYKTENAGLYDKTIGGHVKAGHTWYMTVVQECHQELGFPAVVLSDDEFRTAIKQTDLSRTKILQRKKLSYKGNVNMEQNNRYKIP